ncbi:PadR family transcriptional regulator [Naasia aerilata]|nr:PadR family transcriptional regulator [Naasia aerilata]
MSVRNGILAILTLGPAYGLQLHAELLLRAAHRASVNAGQIYATLDRLGTQGRIERAGATDDGLPLYRLTLAGREEASAWLRADAPIDLDWIEMLDRVLIACSLETADAVSVVDAHLLEWSTHAEPPMPDAPAGTYAARASARLAEAAQDWLNDVRAAAASGTLRRPFSDERPRRGRRPAATAG